MLTEQQRKKVFNIIIMTQCLGMLYGVLFQNGFYLNYFSKLGISSASIALLFALPPFIGAVLMIPFALLSDRTGKKRPALLGQILIILSVVLMIATGWLDSGLAITAVSVSLFIFFVGNSLQSANWFALLSPVVPAEIRGRFFGRLRVTFMTVCILFTLLISNVLEINESVSVFQGLLALVLVAAILRYFTYARIPEIEPAVSNKAERSSFKQAFVQVLNVPGYIQFNSYIFLVTLFTAGIPIIFGLMQKDVFEFSPAQITRLGMLFIGGSVAGNLIGGRAVDRFGTRIVFLFAHVSYALVICSMLLRHWAPWSLEVHAAGCAFFFSMIGAMAGIASTSEVLALIPSANKSLSTAIHMSLFNLAVAFSCLFVSRSIGSTILSEKWETAGQEFTAYDSLLLAFATLILLMLVTLGLVPKIAKKAQLIPGGTYPRI